ncbi:hypothetical protein EJD96_02390 [Herbaspirillum seropedicae]|uniref:hypothetical protein n=1 Tax=Herbaspirillum seropedicae TaxID=964 RepID=UPI00111DD8F4|nr:hypothetical protein [Herbaspirillum seropedicae]QDD63073.1 hypothetical protein EJD96_02390 [Herbaspirillum seropedicae]
MEEHIIMPYVGVGPLRFGMTRDEVHQLIGDPLSIDKSGGSEELTEYWSNNGLQLTYSEMDETLLEISLYPNLQNVQLNGLDLFGVPGTHAFKLLHDWDNAPLTIVGVSIFLKLGLAVNGFFHDDDGAKSVTAFAKGRWDDWPPKEK